MLSGKLFIVNFMVETVPVFSSIIHACLYYTVTYDLGNGNLDLRSATKRQGSDGEFHSA